MTELPPLPEPEGSIEVDLGPSMHEGREIGRLIEYADAYSADQMRAYAEAAAKATREACEKVCANLWDMRDDPRARMYAAKCVAAIRAMGD